MLSVIIPTEGVERTAVATLAALVLFDSYTTGLDEEGLAAIFSLSDAWVIAGLFVGGLMPFLFAALAMEAVIRQLGWVALAVSLLVLAGWLVGRRRSPSPLAVS